MYKPTSQKRLPQTRKALTHKFKIADHRGYLTVGMYPDGALGEIFIVMNKEGSTISGLLDAFATVFSFALQYGVPLSVLVKKLSYTRFEPSGFTGSDELGYASSIIDYVMRWLGRRFLSETGRQLLTDSTENSVDDNLRVFAVNPGPVSGSPSPSSNPGTICSHCGNPTVPTGHCFTCIECGETTGCS